jgi:endonuclease/exonuclease/phosphatase (EEP) superfamily protein YafD
MAMCLCSSLGSFAIADDITYSRDIRPILSANCFACHGADETHREGQLRLDTFDGAVLERDGQAAIVAGDPNAPASSPVMQSLLAHGLRDTWSSSVRGYGYTHGHSLRPNIDLLRIDHILVGAQVGIERTFVGGTAGSDHRPVIADIWLSRNY